jgi:hypothetical protein
VNSSNSNVPPHPSRCFLFLLLRTPGGGSGKIPFRVFPTGRSGLPAFDDDDAMTKAAVEAFRRACVARLEDGDLAVPAPPSSPRRRR